MSEVSIIFNFEGADIMIQCLKTDKMKYICQKYENKIQINMNSLIFLYGGNHLNFDLSFNELANSIDKSNNKMKILVYKNEFNEFNECSCPKCGEKIKIKSDKIDKVILSNNNIKDKIDGIKFQIENIIKISVMNPVIIQLKNINFILNSINESIQKNNEQLKNLFDDVDYNNIEKFTNKNYIKGLLEIKSKEINKNIILFNSDINNSIDVYINKEKVNMTKINNKWSYCFSKEGKYSFEIAFNNVISNMEGFFNECSNIISLDLSNLNISEITNLVFIFNKCYRLKEVKGINKIITDKILDLNSIFQGCQELEYLDLSNCSTRNVKSMAFMFNGCSKLNKIIGLNKLITNKVRDMKAMFCKCKELEYLDISNFDTSNVTDVSGMFSGCNKLKEIIGINNFSSNNVINMQGLFQACHNIEYLSLSNFNTHNVTDMSFMFNECYKLKEIKDINKFNTSKVRDMKAMFRKCKELENLDLSNFNTSNVTNMEFMFYECDKLKYLNLLNFSINCETKNIFSFKQKNKCNFITNNTNLFNLFKSGY